MNLLALGLVIFGAVFFGGAFLQGRNRSHRVPDDETVE